MSVTSSEQEALFFIFDLINKLCKIQDKKGCYKDKHWNSMQTAVLNCQIGLLLSLFNLEQLKNNKTRLIKFLIDPINMSQEDAYSWRCLPLMYLDAKEIYQKDALMDLEDIIKAKNKHDINSPLDEFYLECKYRIDKEDNQISSSLIITQQQIIEKKEYSSIELPKLCYILLNLNIRSKISEENIIGILNFLEGKCASQSIDKIQLTDLSYVLIDLIELKMDGLSERCEQLCNNIISRLVKFLVNKTVKHEFHSCDLAGGHFISTPYNAILIARAISLYYSVFEKNNLEKLLKKYKIKRLIKNIKTYVSIPIITYGIVFLIHLISPYFIRLFNTTKTVNSLGTISAVITIAIGIISLYNYVVKLTAKNNNNLNL